MIGLTVNGERRRYDGDPDMPLLWYLRDSLDLKGAKFGCGAALCGACTVHVNGSAMRSCVAPMASLDGAEITTIEAVSKSKDGGETLHPVQQVWLDEDVAQCGYCQTGQIMAVIDLLSRIPEPTDEDIDANLTNICRCGTYYRLRKAVHRAAAALKEERAS
ncbi:(2Fe-2S)-binding protein [Hyphococcus luteus]|uniref:(2Fe-2S)-binding protein n=1 Tax=Hyphococcus luteus TaxID=2058213 RepID=A0A2S7K8I1_9PROT|nr:(2Fe-2S)-binding protein [Marinicaulis flavus]PQA88817.1 (2Fe-2S)-binding protein [Marinicaulis flavus]